MTADSASTPNPRFKLALICYPYFASRSTGRGHDRYIYELAEGVRARLGQAGLELVDVGFSKSIGQALAKMSQLTRRLAQTKADIYHAASPVGGTLAALLGKAPLVVTIHDLIPFHLVGFDPPWKLWTWRHLIRFCLWRSDAIVVPYQVTKDELVNSLKTPADKVHVINYGVDHESYHPRPEARSRRTILYVGEVKQAKGVDTLLRAFRLVKDSVPDAELVVGGKPCKDQQMLEDMARSLGARDVSFAGFIPEEELATRYARAAVMVFPSRCGFGLSTLEAMACETPVVAAAALDTPEFMGDAGILVQPDNAEELARALVRVLTEPGVSEQLQQKGRERAAQFSWEKMAAETTRVYEQVLRQRASAGAASVAPAR